jgi:hypothetical protein
MLLELLKIRVMKICMSIRHSPHAKLLVRTGIVTGSQSFHGHHVSCEFVLMRGMLGIWMIYFLQNVGHMYWSMTMQLPRYVHTYA